MVIKQKTRIFKEHNYKAIYRNYKTYRYYLNDKEPITELLYPEFYDVKITNKRDSNVHIVIWILNQIVIIFLIFLKR